MDPPELADQAKKEPTFFLPPHAVKMLKDKYLMSKTTLDHGPSNSLGRSGLRLPPIAAYRSAILVTL